MLKINQYFFNCLDLNLSYEIIFLKVFANIIFIIILLILCECISLLFFRNQKNEKTNVTMISALIIIIETFNSGFLMQIAGAISCENVNNHYYLTKNLKIDCTAEDFIKIVILKFC